MQPKNKGIIIDCINESNTKHGEHWNIKKNYNFIMLLIEEHIILGKIKVEYNQKIMKALRHS